jgi:hypothetical protein
MNINQFKKWAKTKLGESKSCGVNVELSEEQLELALEDAKDWWNAHLGLYKEGVLALTAGQQDYDLSGVTPRIEDVVNVWLPSSAYQIDYNLMYPGFLDIQGVPYQDGSRWGMGYPMTTLVQSMQTIEQTARVITADPSWEFYCDLTSDPIVAKLRIMPESNLSGSAVYMYRIDPRDIRLEHYKQRDLWLIREYALAEAKYTLGRIRGKYTSGLPAAGGDRTLDGEALISESREDKEKLDQKILDYDGPIMPFVG